MKKAKTLKIFFWSAVALTLLLFIVVFYQVNMGDIVEYLGFEGPLLPENTLQGNLDRQDQNYITICGVGDVMLARKVGRAIKTQGPDYPLRVLGPELAAADITFANLESPIAQSGQPLPGKQICFRAPPVSLESLKAGGFDIVSLANNHAVDYDSPALLETFDRLSEAGIAVIGAGSNISQARQAVILERKGMKIAFLAYSDLADIYFSYKYRRAHRAQENLPGVAPMILPDMLDDVRAARAQADAVVVSLHWGNEYTEEPTPQQQEIAHRLIDFGADLILGHHPHWLQGLEVYQGKLIAYSLGNFVFDQDWSEPTQEGLVLQVQIDPTGLKEARLKPIYINTCQPQWASEAREEKIFNQVIERCRKLNTEVKWEGDWAKIKVQKDAANI